MRFKTSNIDCEVSYKKAGNELLVPKPEIRMRTFDGKLVSEVRTIAKSRFQRNGKDLEVQLTLKDTETGEVVDSSKALAILENYKYAYVDEDGKVVEKTKDAFGEEIMPISYFRVREDGTEEEVAPFTRTNLIEIPEENWVTSPSIEAFLIKDIYEIFPKDEQSAIKLFEEAERRLKADQVGVVTFSFGNGFLQYYAFICPYFQEGKFVWLMKLSDTKPVYNHLLEPPIKAKLSIREAPPLATLPPVQVLVATAKRKK